MTDPILGGARPGPQALSSAISAILAVSATTAASAQEQPAEVTGLDEVIVTATKRAESLQDVSESISAFDTDAIAMRGLQQIDDVAKYIPGLSLAQREPGGTTIVFRGVASSGLQFGAVSSSALYLDEQPITQSGRSPDPRFIDIERVEALRGPQGTLYGASSQSGTLRVITNKPDPSGFDAWAEAELSSVAGGSEGYDVSGMLNVPIGERVALRLVGFTAEDAGYVDNVLSDSQGGTFDNANVVAKDVNSIETSGGRAALRFDISENVDLTLGAIYQEIQADGHSDMNEGLGDLKQVRFEEESLSDEWTQLSLTLNASLPFADLVVAGSYFDRKFEYEADATDYEASLNNPIYVAYDFGVDPRGFATNNEDTEIETLEVRLQSASDAESRWSWLAGAFYSKETGHTEFGSFIRGYADTPSFAYFNYYEQNLTGNSLVPTDQWWLGVYDTELKQKALFGEVGFDVTENFTITAGGRWFEYERFYRLRQEHPIGFTGFNLLDDAVDNDESGSVMKLNLTYNIDDDHMVYATYSEGFRNGGSNPVRPISILPREFSSDTLDNYEVGAKTEWMDNRLRFNVAAYLMEWNDFAVQVEDPQNGGVDEDDVPIPNVFALGYVNLPTAEIPGIEAELTFVVNDAWQVDASLGYNDAQISEETVLTLVDDQGRAFERPVEKGARLPLTPDWSASLGVEWRSRGELLSAQPFVRADFAYVGEVVTNLEGFESVIGQAGVSTQDAYETGDLRLGLESESWTAALFVRNVTDERAVTFRSNRWAEPRLSIIQPRTYGVQFRYDF
ncbi:MAG TPA: TonB-dependent receptor [Steroidobacteraceae bacterium]|nr:TonB-dependent receptor [Steroidobacteraceae bacterium]